MSHKPFQHAGPTCRVMQHCHDATFQGCLKSQHCDHCMHSTAIQRVTATCNSCDSLTVQCSMPTFACTEVAEFYKATDCSRHLSDPVYAVLLQCAAGLRGHHAAMIIAT